MEKRIVTTRDRETAYRNVINMWLKASPDNIRYCEAIIAQNRMRRALLHDDFGGMKQNPKDMALGLSLPIDLYYLLDKYEQMHGRRFMQDKKDLIWFGKHFPQFVVPKKI